MRVREERADLTAALIRRLIGALRGLMESQNNGPRDCSAILSLARSVGPDASYVLSEEAQARLAALFLTIPDLAHALATAARCHPLDDDQFLISGSSLDGSDIELTVAVHEGVLTVL